MSWIRRQRLWQGLHSIEVLVPSEKEYFHGYSSVQVWIHTPLRYSIWNNSLPRKQRAALLSEHDTPPRAFHTRQHVLACGWRAWTGLSTHGFLCLLKKKSHLHPHWVMFHVQSMLLDFPPLPLPQHGAPSLLFPSHGGTHCDPHLGGQSGRLAEQKSSLRFMSPTSLSRRAVQRLHLCSHHQGEQVSGRHTIHARTSPLHLCLQKWIRDKSMWMLASPLFTQKREASAAPARIYQSDRENSVSRSSHSPVTGKLAAMYSHKRKSSRDPQSSQESYSERERGHSPSIEKFGIFLTSEQIKPPKERRQPYLNSLKRNIIRDYFLMRWICKNGKQAGSTGMTLRESNRQVHSHRVEPYQANQENENVGREQVWLHAELENCERALQETRIGTLQEMEELKKICCAVAEKTQRLRMDELTRQEFKESQSTVNQLTVQIQELQDKVNSPNYSRHFHDLETVSSSGLFHVPKHPLNCSESSWNAQPRFLPAAWCAELM